MLLILSGKFTMGTDDVSTCPNERPAHREEANFSWVDCCLKAVRLCISSAGEDCATRRIGTGILMDFEWFYRFDLLALYAAATILIAGGAEFGNWIGLRSFRAGAEKADVSTLASAALRLLALLIAFSFSMALSRYERRRDMVLEEANAIGSTANFTLMLPPSAQRPILSLLREYTAVRVALGVPYDSQKMEKDIARSLDIQARLCAPLAAGCCRSHGGTAVAARLPVYLLLERDKQHT
jgi:hypothetical protein